MTIDPDTKDWTWVLDRPCPDCGFDASTVPGPEVPERLRAAVPVWVAVLECADVRHRPRPDVWSPLEYAAHVRDVCRNFDRRLRRMLAEDDPTFDNWDQDATAAEERYGEQDPAAVATELQVAADTLADRFAAVEGGQWERTGTRSDGARFTVDRFARYFLHDVAHHLHDVDAR